MPNRVEELASKAAGAVKVAKATLVGLSGVFKHLAKEHGEVSALLMRVKMSSDPEVRRELFPKIRMELVSHEQAEIRELYPVFREYPETQPLAEDHDSDALSLSSVIEELTRIPMDSDAWEHTFDRLVTLVQKHVKLEENHYFPAAQRAFGGRADELLARFEQTKAQVLQEIERGVTP
jgi:hypothetical protein